MHRPCEAEETQGAAENSFSPPYRRPFYCPPSHRFENRVEPWTEGEDGRRLHAASPGRLPRVDPVALVADRVSPGSLQRATQPASRVPGAKAPGSSSPKRSGSILSWLFMPRQGPDCFGAEGGGGGGCFFRRQPLEPFKGVFDPVLGFSTPRPSKTCTDWPFRYPKTSAPNLPFSTSSLTLGMSAKSLGVSQEVYSEPAGRPARPPL